MAVTPLMSTSWGSAYIGIALKSILADPEWINTAGHTGSLLHVTPLLPVDTHTAQRRTAGGIRSFTLLGSLNRNAAHIVKAFKSIFANPERINITGHAGGLLLVATRHASWASANAAQGSRAVVRVSIAEITLHRRLSYRKSAQDNGNNKDSGSIHFVLVVG